LFAEARAANASTKVAQKLVSILSSVRTMASPVEVAPAPEAVRDAEAASIKVIDISDSPA
jgi:hypothetical protein